MASISRGRPASPINIPSTGMQMPPTIVRCRIGTFEADAGQPTRHANRTVITQNTPLMIGVNNPTKLARDCQSERF